MRTEEGMITLEELVSYRRRHLTAGTAITARIANRLPRTTGSSSRPIPHFEFFSCFFARSFVRSFDRPLARFTGKVSRCESSRVPSRDTCLPFEASTNVFLGPLSHDHVPTISRFYAERYLRTKRTGYTAIHRTNVRQRAVLYPAAVARVGQRNAHR